MQADFDDIRFTQNNGTTLIDAWLESKVDSASAKTWAEFPTTPANTVEQTYYMYYGSVGAASAWDGTNTFLHFDDFEGAGLLSWTDNAGTWVNDGGYRKQTSTVQHSYKFSYISVSETDYIVHSKFKVPTAWNEYGREGLVTEKDGSTNQWHCGNLYHTDRSRSAISVISLSHNDPTAMGFTAQLDTWYEVDMLRQANVQKVSIRPVGNALSWQAQTTFTSRANKIAGLGGGLNNAIWHDDFYVRKYASGPPTYAFGSEESAPTGGNPFWYYQMLRRRNQ